MREYFKYRPKTKIEIPHFEKQFKHYKNYACIYLKTTGNNLNYDFITYIEIVNSDKIFIIADGIIKGEIIANNENEYNTLYRCSNCLCSEASCYKKYKSPASETAYNIISAVQGYKMVMYNSIFAYPFLYNELKKCGFDIDKSTVELKNEKFVNFSELCRHLHVKQKYKSKAMEEVYNKLYS